MTLYKSLQINSTCSPVRIDSALTTLCTCNLMRIAKDHRLANQFVPRVPNFYTLLDLSIQRIRNSFLVNVIGKLCIFWVRWVQKYQGRGGDAKPTETEQDLFFKHLEDKQ